LSLDFLNSSSENKHDVGGCFCHFNFFLYLTVFMTQFVQVIDRVFSSYSQSNCSFIPADFLQPWRAQQRKFMPPS
jgi:hypothetical protein